MKVRLATQVFSNTVASDINTLNSSGSEDKNDF